ncbi:hypothetical protein A4U88_2051 [Serratia marcescens]|nr:hypothetical protein A4U88_2051 [Serratia marcescens]
MITKYSQTTNIDVIIQRINHFSRHFSLRHAFLLYPCG